LIRYIRFHDDAVIEPIKHRLLPISTTTNLPVLYWVLSMPLIRGSWRYLICIVHIPIQFLNISFRTASCWKRTENISKFPIFKCCPRMNLRFYMLDLEADKNCLDQQMFCCVHESSNLPAFSFSASSLPSPSAAILFLADNPSGNQLIPSSGQSGKASSKR
jgi:hypothetical protein